MDSVAKNRLKIFFILSAIVLPLDQITKWLSRTYLTEVHEYRLGPLFARFELAENPGAFLSLGSGWSDQIRFWVLTVAVFFILAWTAWSLFVSKNQNRVEFWGLQFLLVGGIGNLIDRAYKGTVTDFVQVGIGPLQTGIFNIVDMLILASLLVMLLGPLIKKYQAKIRPKP
jgi:signal peptidase II